MQSETEHQGGAPRDTSPHVSPSRAVVRSVQGIVFAFGAPLGWLLVQMLSGTPLVAALQSKPMLYGYLFFGTACAFGLFGYLLGRNEDELTQLARRYRDLSIRDDLTGLYNSRYFWDRLDAELHRASRHDASTAVLLMDLDHFKRVNDNWGHRFGDHVLEVTGEYMTELTRRSDFAARVGGEEFAVVLPETDQKEAERVGERIRQALESHTFEPEEGETFHVTLSVGVALETSGSEPDPEQLYREADEALYRAKEAGRNTLESSSAIEVPEV